MKHILLTNDDGYQADGLQALAAALEGFATVSIVAPSREQSGAAQSLTLRQPIVCNKIAERQWAIDGTPADCVIVALHKLLPEKREQAPALQMASGQTRLRWARPSARDD